MYIRSIITLLTLYFIADISAKFYKKNVTDFAECKVHRSIQESDYKVFYYFSDMKQNTSMDDDTLAVDFHFSVLANNDAHLLLAPSTYKNNDPVYEIIFGCCGAAYTQLRRKVGAEEKLKLPGNVLSPIDVQSFWVHITRLDGWIHVGREGETIPFLSWKDCDPIDIRSFSFRTWGNVQAKWYFDCPRDTGDNVYDMCGPSEDDSRIEIH